MRVLFLILTLTLLAAGCKAQKQLTDHRDKKTEREVRYVDRIVEVPTVDIDTVIKWQTLEVEKPIYIQDETGQAKAKLWKNKYDELVAEFQSAPDPIVVTDTFIEEKVILKEKVVEKTRRNRWGWAESMVLAAIILAAALMALRYFTRKT